MYIPKTIKALVKRALRQLQPVRAQILRPVELRLSAVEQHLPALLNAVSSVGALGYELSALADKLSALAHELSTAQRDLWQSAGNANKEIGHIWQRLEFVRKEILYELKYRVEPSRQQRPARILSPEKLEKARSAGMKVNLGCGHVPLEDYLNVDQRELPGVDVIADAGALPFEEGSLQEIFSTHVLEHFPQQHLQRLLPYWRSLLASNGVFRAIVPDGEAMLASVTNGSYRFEHFREVLFGSQEYEGDFHFNLLTPDSLTDLLKQAGFDEVSVPARGRKNDICFEFEISAKKQV